ncbi:class I SAM-dependent DNA methyltransferase [soil metagenome]
MQDRQFIVNVSARTPATARDAMNASELPSIESVEAFIERWKPAQAAEIANAQSFLKELCRDVLGVPEPDPATKEPERDAYVFERPVVFDDQAGQAAGRIDLYRRACFVSENKQGIDEERQKRGKTRGTGHGRRDSPAWERVMRAAKEQAARYARNLDVGDWREPLPPLLLVIDVGYCLDLYANFGHPQRYVPFPDQRGYRVNLTDLRDEGVRQRLRLAWTDPEALDPSKRQAEVTRQLAATLAELATSLEADGHSPASVFGFLTRSLFTMFAEDTGLLPARSFIGLLESYQDQLDVLPEGLASLWRTMDAGGFSPDLRAKVLQFNGRLFAQTDAPALTRDQLALLLRASRADWTDVEPAIFGTLLERALDPHERHKLGAHYTPRAYVERLVVPAVIEPLRQEWEAVQAAVASLEEEHEEQAYPTDRERTAGQLRTRRAITETLSEFRRRLTTVRILDPACGSGNFLYVTLEHLKRLEGEVRQTQEQYGVAALEMESAAVTPEQFLGIEVNPRAAAVADLVLWIGYLQWHLRTYGGPQAITEPVLRAYGNVVCRDAVLDFDERQPRQGEDGEPLTMWDGRTTKPHPATGEPVPDPEARVPVFDYTNPRPTDWPEADFIIGNPPFVGSQMMRDALGDGYTEALRKAYPKVPGSADLVMYWWDKAADTVRHGKAERFGFITTNSVTQTHNRRVIERHLGAEPPLALAYAVPDHPWVDSALGAGVRIAMTVGVLGPVEGVLAEVRSEEKTEGEEARRLEMDYRQGEVFPDLTVGVDTTRVQPLKANQDLSFMGVKLVGDFTVTEDEARALGLGMDPAVTPHLPRLLNGSDVVRTSRDVRVIDLYGLTSAEARESVPSLYQRVVDHVRPVRESKRGKTKDATEYAERWHEFAKPRPEMRSALSRLSRFIVTSEVSKHRVFAFLAGDILPDGALISVATEDAYHLGILSSRPHVVWTLGAGGTLEDRPRYTSTKTFQPFPFPVATPEQEEAIRATAERLHAHRDRVQAEHPDLTLTAIYNALEAVRAGETLTGKNRDTYERGHVGILRELHDELDAAVFEAYGWPSSLSDEDILRRVVLLNEARQQEEDAGLVRYIRPAYQNPDAGGQLGLGVEVEAVEAAPLESAPVAWPDTLPGRALALRQSLNAAAGPLTVEQVARHFIRSRHSDVEALLETLVGLGQARHTEDGRYGA